MTDTVDVPPTVPIGDYAIIGDCRSAALVSKTGSIDWLCWPRFDSSSMFGALLDRRRGGRFLVRPRGDATITRQYVDDTAVLETTFHTAAGVARLTDLMPVASEPEKAGQLWPGHEILRHVVCVGGEVEIEVVFDPRPDYASLLLLGLMGYADPRSARMRGTVQRIRERLGTNGLLYRYRGDGDGLTGTEGAFTICSFWSVSCCGLQGDVDTARREFEHVLSFANDVGLLAEQIDPTSGAALGNFPQAFSHVGLINAALILPGRQP